MCAGNLRLKKLRLKPDALQEFQLPVKLKHGYVGSLHIVIPFVGITSTPVQVNLEDVFLVMGLMREFDGRAHIKGMRKAKEQAAPIPPHLLRLDRPHDCRRRALRRHLRHRHRHRPSKRRSSRKWPPASSTRRGRPPAPRRRPPPIKQRSIEVGGEEA